MYEAKLIRLTRGHGRVDVEIQYIDGTEKLNKTYNLDRANKVQIKALARSEVKRLNELKAEVINLPLNTNIDLTEPTPKVPPTPTAAQIAKQEWFTDWRKLNALLQLANAKLILPTDTRIVTLEAKLKTGWKPSYLGDI